MIKKVPGILILTIFSAILISCNDNKPLPVNNAGEGFNFGVLRYDSAALEYRLDSIHNRGLILQLYISDATKSSSPFQLISYAFDTLNDYNNSWLPDTLRVVADSLPKSFKGRIVTGNTEVTREQLYNVVRYDNEQRFSYDYVLFTPMLEEVFNHVVYLMKAYKDGKPVSGANTQMTSPMPPGRTWN